MGLIGGALTTNCSTITEFEFKFILTPGRSSLSTAVTAVAVSCLATRKNAQCVLWTLEHDCVFGLMQFSTSMSQGTGARCLKNVASSYKARVLKGSDKNRIIMKLLKALKPKNLQPTILITWILLRTKYHTVALAPS